MEYGFFKGMENIWDFGINWNFKSITALTSLVILPNVLGMINLGTQFGFKIHTFQVAIFIAAIIFGPKGGLLSGAIGSLYSGFLMSNPYLVIGNAILGFCVGYFAQKMNVILAVLLGFGIQLPWLIATDLWLMKMPPSVLGWLVVSLLASNVIWGFLALKLAPKIRSSIE